MTDGAETSRQARLAVHVHRATGILFLGIGCYVLWKAINFTYLTPIGPGPGFFPFWVGAGLVLLSLIFLGQSLVSVASLSEYPFFPDKPGWVRIFATLVALTLFVLAVERIGFTPTTVLFSLFLFRVYGQVGLTAAVVCSMIAGPALYYVFSEILAVRLPASPVAILPSVGF